MCGSGGGSGAEEVSIVVLAFFGTTEGGVGFGDFHEALGGMGVVGVVVWMVFLREGVELPVCTVRYEWFGRKLRGIYFLMSPEEALGSRPRAW